MAGVTGVARGRAVIDRALAGFGVGGVAIVGLGHLADPDLELADRLVEAAQIVAF